jgi:hypothetical protein
MNIGARIRSDVGALRGLIGARTAQGGDLCDIGKGRGLLARQEARALGRACVMERRNGECT